MCECSEIGNTSHFFLHSNLYGQLRHDLLDRVSTYCQPTVDLFLYGNTDLTDVENAELFSGATLYGPRREKTCLRGVANKTGADQPAHPRSLISAFVIHFLESTICKRATGKIRFVGNREDRFCRIDANILKSKRFC